MGTPSGTIMSQAKEKMKYKTKSCRYCQDDFQPAAPSHLYCSDKCAANGVIQRHYKKSYGLGYEEVKQLRKDQNHLCAICGEKGFMMNSRVKSALCVDHDHKTGEIRGMLCHNCNRGLGLFQDSLDRLKSAIAYLEGATTISQESTDKCLEAPDVSEETMI